MQSKLQNFVSRCAGGPRTLLGICKEAQSTVTRLAVGPWDQRRVAALRDKVAPDLCELSQSELDSIAAETHAMLLSIPDDKTLNNPFGTLMQSVALITERTTALRPKAFSRTANGSIDQHISTLCDEQHKILLLRINEGLTYKQIAEKLEISPRRALTQLSRAYSALRCPVDLTRAEDWSLR